MQKRLQDLFLEAFLLSSVSWATSPYFYSALQRLCSRQARAFGMLKK
jgi:hypothetical protein